MKHSRNPRGRHDARDVGGTEAGRAGSSDCSSGRLLLAVMALAVLVSVLNNTMVNVAIPRIDQGLDISGGQTGWIVTGFVPVFAVGIPIYGRISDFYSLRRTFSLALVVFAGGFSGLHSGTGLRGPHSGPGATGLGRGGDP